MADINPEGLDAVQNHNVADLYRVFLCECVANFSILTFVYIYTSVVFTAANLHCVCSLFSFRRHFQLWDQYSMESSSAIEIQKATQHSVSFISSSKQQNSA